MFLELNTNIFTSRNVFFAYFVDVLFGSCSLQIRLVIAFFFYVFEFTFHWIIVSNLISNATSKSFCSAKLHCFKLVMISFQSLSVHNLYLVRINVSFKDIWKRLSVCLKMNGSLMCQNIGIFNFFVFNRLSTGNATKLNVSRNKVPSESNDALSYVLDRAFHVNVVQERYQWRRYGWRNVFIVAFINLSQRTVLNNDNYKLPYTEICKTY